MLYNYTSNYWEKEWGKKWKKYITFKIFGHPILQTHKCFHSVRMESTSVWTNYSFSHTKKHSSKPRSRWTNYSSIDWRIYSCFILSLLGLSPETGRNLKLYVLYAIGGYSRCISAYNQMKDLVSRITIDYKEQKIKLREESKYLRLMRFKGGKIDEA